MKADASSDAHDSLSCGVECALCLCIYEDPRVLPCGHSFCRACIAQLEQTRACVGWVWRRDCIALQCPLDRRKLQLFVADIDDLPRNYALSQALRAAVALAEEQATVKAEEASSPREPARTSLGAVALAAAAFGVSVGYALGPTLERAAGMACGALLGAASVAAEAAAPAASASAQFWFNWGHRLEM
eukprot:tig00000254_g22582.t1